MYYKITFDIYTTESLRIHSFEAIESERDIFQIIYYRLRCQHIYIYIYSDPAEINYLGLFFEHVTNCIRFRMYILLK